MACNLSQVPSPCSRSKVIVNRSSISYKRLLPYLKDLDKDDSSDIKVLQSHNHWPKVEETMNETTLVLNPSYKQQNNISPFWDSPMVNSGGNCDFAENPVQEKPILNSDEEILQNPTRIESPIHEATSKVWFNDEHMDELSGKEQKGADKERCIYDAENSKASAGCSEDMTQSTPPDVDLTRKLDDVENGSRRTILDSELINAPKEKMEQVKRVCQSAFSVEEQAKSRMRQMFCDLNAHCKIPGPRVSFSDAVDERIIP